MEDFGLVSIIVPIYKVEKFLETCLDSLAAQTYKNIEVIMVNDGSPDNSAEIAENYVKKDQRFKLISQENRGLNMARKAGFDNSSGLWIMFVDSDDAVNERSVEFLIRACDENQVELAVAQYQTFFEQLPIIEQEYRSFLLDNQQALQAYLTDGYTLNLPNFFTQTAWGKIFSRRLIELADWDFSNYKINEDEFFSVFYYKNLQNGVAFLENQLYYYRQNPQSITNQKEYVNFYKGEKISRFELLKRITEARLQHFSNEFEPEIWFWFCFHYLIHIRSNCNLDQEIPKYEKDFWRNNREKFNSGLKKYELNNLYQEMLKYLDDKINKPVKYDDFKFLIKAMEQLEENQKLIEENQKIHQRNEELWQENNQLKIELETIKSFRGSVKNMKESSLNLVKKVGK